MKKSAIICLLVFLVFFAISTLTHPNNLDKISNKAIHDFEQNINGHDQYRLMNKGTVENINTLDDLTAKKLFIINNHLVSTDWHVRHLAIWQIFYLAKQDNKIDKSIFSKIVKDDPDSRNRRAAAEIIGELRVFSGIDVLRESLNDSDSFVRGAAAISLGKLNDQGSLGALKQLYRKQNLLDREKEQILLALLMLEDLEADHKIIDQLANIGNPLVRANAIRLVSYTGRKKFITLLLEIVDDKSETGEILGKCDRRNSNGYRLKVRDVAVQALERLANQNFNYEIYATDKEKEDAISVVNKALKIYLKE